VLAIAAVATFNIGFSSQSDDLSAVSLANVEALAGENSDIKGNYDSFTNGSCTISLPNGSKLHGTWYDCNTGNTLCIQGCVSV
jgi:hypothetical protein